VKLGYKINRNILFTLINIRFAFLHFVDIQLATQVMEHSDQYYIDNQRLSISYKLLNETIIANNYSGSLESNYPFHRNRF
jgi:hypothetical protein